MHTTLIIDTDIIIDCLRNYTPAINFIKKMSTPALMSTITLAEIFAGLRNSDEKKVFESFSTDFRMIAVDQDIAQIGGSFRERYGKSHGTGLMDALIAATAQHHNATLVTLNTKHFPMVKTTKPYEK